MNPLEQKKLNMAQKTIQLTKKVKPTLIISPKPLTPRKSKGTKYA